jgi:hypothetical protein
MDESTQWMERMRKGDFAAAWRINDLLLRRGAGMPCTELPRHLQPIWNGAPLKGRRVLVRCYHGLGDTIQFIRYIAVLKAIAANVTVWAQATLISLLRTVREIDQILPLHDGTPDCHYDVDVELMELPYIFRTTLESLPATVPYIKVDAVSLCDEEVKVGVVWNGGDWDLRRNVPFSVMTSLAELQGVSFYALQKGASRCESHERFKKILPEQADALTTARIMRALDLVISIDSMPAHLAGALALPTWTLLQKDADWRWMNDRDDSPWYPTMRLFRQRRSGDWQQVLNEVKHDLARFIEGKTTR